MFEAKGGIDGKAREGRGKEGREGRREEEGQTTDKNTQP